MKLFWLVCMILCLIAGLTGILTGDFTKATFFYMCAFYSDWKLEKEFKE